MRLRCLAYAFALGACASTSPVVSSPAPSPAPSAEVDAAIARVEHGLVPEARVRGERGWSIEERLRAHHIPGVSIAVIHDHRVAWAKAYGVADAETRAPLTATTPMQAASVSKMVTALATLKAVEAKRLALDANVNDALRSWHLPENDATRASPVTLRRLLTHTAGVNLKGAPGYLKGEALPTLLQVLDGTPPATTPAIRASEARGADFHYSSGGTTIVQQALVDLDGRAFPALMHDAIFAPLGMTHSTFDEPTELASSAHDVDGKPLPGKHRIYPEMGAAGLWTTPSDLARLVVEIQRGREGRSSIVSKNVADEMTTPSVSLGDDTGVALGTFVEKHGAGTYWGHDGLGEGAIAMLRASTTSGDGAVVMMNGWQGFTGAPLLLEILRSIAIEYRWEGWAPPPIDAVAIDQARLAALAGAYGVGADGSIVVSTKGDHLVASAAFDEPCDLVPMSDATFACREDGSRYAFRGDELLKTPTSWPSGGPSTTLTRRHDLATEPLRALEAGRYDEALATYRRFLLANPNDPLVSASRFEDLGMDLVDRQRKLDEAIVVLRAGVALHPESARLSAALGEALARAGRKAEAASFHESAKALLASDHTASEWDGIYVRWKLSTIERLGVLRVP